MQRTFSGFPAGLPGCALLLLRLVVGGSASLSAALVVTSAHEAMSRSVALAALVLLMDIALIIGLLTPIASALLCLGSILVTVTPDIAGHLPLFESWTARLEFVAMSMALIPLGPGAFSVDARLYGRREIKSMSRNGGADSAGA